MTCLAYYDNSSSNTSNTFHATIQCNVNNVNEEVGEEKVVNNSIASSCHKPLPTALTDFIAESMCGILATCQAPQSQNWDYIPLPELVFFVEKVTTKAKIDYHTAIVALILVSRLKKNLPKNALGEYDTCHRLFLSAILVASKDLTRPYKLTQLSTPSSSQEELPLSLAIEQQQQQQRDNQFPPDLILSSPSSSMTSSSPSSCEEDHDDFNINNNINHHITNSKLAEISGIYNVQDVNQMEDSFLKLLGRQIWVYSDDVNNFIEENKNALGIC
ncbi:hypothetical protein Glove_46g73 [Diversispora epigaea]|uniref:Cyclin N-terminal domain-containing protein n=1 Tax=Diversispora epigaea TaxID=1348612 RepID=A0A397JF89_9GLOM|nr:hypothetical protein Glove_46g73 [Diversispora epigaea]